MPLNLTSNYGKISSHRVYPTNT